MYKAKANYKTVFPKLPSMVKLHYSKWQVSQELVMIKDAISVPCYGLLKQLGKPSDDNFTKNPGAVFQKESSAPPLGATVALDEPTENAKRGISLKDAAENLLPVAPFAAPAQKKYNESADKRSKDAKRCGAAPFGCPNLAINCSGRRSRRYCVLVDTNHPSVTVPVQEEDQERIRSAYIKEQGRLAAAARRDKKKAAKAAGAAH